MFCRGSLASSDGGSDSEQEETRLTLLRSALQFLEQGRLGAGDSAAHLYHDLIHQYRHRLEEVQGAKADDVQNSPQGLTLRSLRLETVQHERKQLIELRSSGRIGDATLRALERELDLNESRLSL